VNPRAYARDVARSTTAGVAAAWGKAALILCYHRIGAPGRDPQLLAVSPENFASHLQAIAAHAPTLPLRALDGRRARRGVVVTFDDAKTTVQKLTEATTNAGYPSSAVR